MNVVLTDDEIEEIDSMMNDHMYGHSISNSYSNFRCDPRCRMQALGYAINKVLSEKKVEHDLVFLSVLSKTRGEYKCRCGVEGGATLASHLGDVKLVEARLRKNHEMHRVRAHIRENSGSRR